MNTVSLFNRVSYDCSQCVTGRYSTSFSSAIRLLHADLRDPIHSIYGFVRLADEIVDTFHEYDKEELLRQFENDTWSAIGQGISLNPILQSFQITVNKYRIDPMLIAAFFSSMRTDLEKKEWVDARELDAYIYGSAEVVGLMCLQVFCEGDSRLAGELKSEATALGAAFQKVNFLRDLRDDLQNLDRRYFPQVEASRFSPEAKASIEQDILQDFRKAYEGIARLPAKARFGVMVAYRYYLRLFEKIRQLPPEALMKKRVRIPNFEKAWLLLKTTIS